MLFLLCALRSGHILRTLGPADATAYLSMWVPWPFNDVAMLLDAVGAVMLQEDGCFAVALCSPPGWGPRVGAEAKAAAAARGRSSSKGSAGGGSPGGEVRVACGVGGGCSGPWFWAAYGNERYSSARCPPPLH